MSYYFVYIKRHREFIAKLNDLLSLDSQMYRFFLEILTRNAVFDLELCWAYVR